MSGVIFCRKGSERSCLGKIFTAKKRTRKRNKKRNPLCCHHRGRQRCFDCVVQPRCGGMSTPGKDFLYIQKYNLPFADCQAWRWIFAHLPSMLATMPHNGVSRLSRGIVSRGKGKTIVGHSVRSVGGKVKPWRWRCLRAVTALCRRGWLLGRLPLCRSLGAVAPCHSPAKRVRFALSFALCCVFFLLVWNCISQHNKSDCGAFCEVVGVSILEKVMV